MASSVSGREPVGIWAASDEAPLPGRRRREKIILLGTTVIPAGL
jgi:hypothetical protein